MARPEGIEPSTPGLQAGFAVAGMDTFPKWAFLEGTLFQGPSNFEQVPQPANPLSGKEVGLYAVGDATV
jgi:hypothetical protein